MKKILLAGVMLALCTIGIINFSHAGTAGGGKSEMKQEVPLQILTNKIQSLTGASGVFYEKEGVFKVGFPRSDIKPDILGVKLTPAMGLGVWAAFKIEGNQAIGIRGHYSVSGLDIIL